MLSSRLKATATIALAALARVTISVPASFIVRVSSAITVV